VSDGIAGSRVVGIDLRLHRSVTGRIDELGNELGWVGIDKDPKVNRVHRGGHLSKERDALIRWAAVEAIGRQTEPAVKDVKDGIIARRGKNVRNIAKVAAARKMLDVVYYVLRDGQARCLTKAAA
jgi:hypothetical protein